MGLLKTVFEVNLGLFGKPAADGYVLPLILRCLFVNGGTQDASKNSLTLRHS